MRRSRLLNFAIIMFVSWALAASAEESVSIKGRPFYQMWSKGMRTFPNPWPRLDFKLLSKDKSLLRLQAWLLGRESTMSNWPPRFRNETEAIAAIREWRKWRTELKAQEQNFSGDMDALTLISTFYLFGHNVDEANAAEDGLRVLELGRKKFLRSRQLDMLQGLFHLRLGGPSISKTVSYLEWSSQPKEKADPAIKSLCLAGLANIYLLTCHTHFSVLTYSFAHLACPKCLEPLKEGGWPQFLKSRFAHDPLKPSEPLAWTENNTVLSPLLGLSFTPGPNWLKGSPQGGTYDPTRPAQTFDVEANALPNGLVHSLTIVAWVDPAKKRKPTLDEFLDGFGKNPKMVAMKKIAPLVSHPFIQDWLSFETKDAVGNSDRIAGYILKTQLIKPRPFTVEEHMDLSKTEVSCMDQLKSPKGGGAFYHQNERSRLGAPVQMLLIYNGSKGTLDKARESLQSIVRSLKIDPRAGTEALPDL